MKSVATFAQAAPPVTVSRPIQSARDIDLLLVSDLVFACGALAAIARQVG